jgi:PPOX class probable F420-dependent enzyme
MDRTLARTRLAEARVGRLATVTAGGAPHAVPCCFALVGDTVFTAVDAKPKSTTALRRVDNIRSSGIATLLADHYDEDWTKLWWVRVDGRARLLDTRQEGDRAVSALVDKYPQYHSVEIPGPFIALDVDRWTSWP